MDPVEYEKILARWRREDRRDRLVKIATIIGWAALGVALVGWTIYRGWLR